MTNTPVIMLPPSSLAPSPTASLMDSFHSLMDAPSRQSQPTSSSRDLSVGEWAHGKSAKCKPPVLVHGQDWKDVNKNIKQMDQLYDATFFTWLKSEDNVLVTAMYLHRIANEYSLDRIINAVKWLVADWRWESTSILVRHITVGWTDEQGDLQRAQLLRHLTQTWATQYTATLITTILATPPYVTTTHTQRERFLRAFTDGWDFSKLSEFFMYLQSQANVDYKVKCLMLQEAARRERETLSAKLNKRRRKRQLQLEDPSDDTGLPTIEPASSSVQPDPSEDPSDLPVDPATSVTTSAIATFPPPPPTTPMPTLPMVHGASSPPSCLTSSFLPTTSPPASIPEEAPHFYPSLDDLQVLPSPSSSPSLPPSNTPPSSSRFHHRRISSNDLLDVKRQRYSDEPDENESPAQDLQEPCSSSLGCLNNASSNNTTSSTPASHPSPHTYHHHHHHHHHHHQYHHHHHDRLTSDLSRLDLGAVSRTSVSSVSPGTPSSWLHRRRSSTSNNPDAPTSTPTSSSSIPCAAEPSPLMDATPNEEDMDPAAGSSSGLRKQRNALSSSRSLHPSFIEQ
ncbi:hypothetical protein DM01DRAFT_1405015 [Hesseltinella vesiculosa]|uniref:Uncharacterized protein n=1 Tax=Hesseltinella vesiculosa TaxID=101127 RepID=A0A1X2GQX8_9FUNG|nr:hypothetical protein DM01DRAFT_1405015 [Hesseltinella vesiculosa]